MSNHEARGHANQVGEWFCCRSSYESGYALRPDVFVPFRDGPPRRVVGLAEAMGFPAEAFPLLGSDADLAFAFINFRRR